MSKTEKSVLQESLAVTGIIGSGKSVFCSFLSELGAKVVSADELGAKALQNSDVKLQLGRAFGDTIFGKNKCIDKAKLANLAFKDSISLQKLNNCTHGFIKEQAVILLGSIIEAGALAIYDVPLFFEAGLDKQKWKAVILVAASESTCIKRVLNRNPNLSKQDVLARFEHQIPISVKRSKVDRVIENDADLEQLRLKAKEVFQTYNVNS